MPLRTAAVEVETFDVPTVYSRNAPQLFFAYDISLVDAEGNALQPNEPVTVTLSTNLADTTLVNVLHESDDGEVTDLGNVMAMNGEISFQTDGFSVFYGYEVVTGYNNTIYPIGIGKAYKLSEILDYLNVTECEASQVTSVTPNDPEGPVKAEKVEGDWNITLEWDSGETYELILAYAGGTVTIAMKYPVMRYYLDGTEWSMPTEFRTIVDTNVASTADNAVNGFFARNEVRTSVEEIVRVAGSDFDQQDKMVIYARPGMALKFARWSSGWGTVESGHSNVIDWMWDNPREYDSNHKYYGKANDGSLSFNEGGINYIYIKDDITTHTEIKFQVAIGYSGSNVGYKDCDITIHVVPYESGSPMLLKTALEQYASAETKSQYTIKELPATLYNYDGQAFNIYHAALAPKATIDGKSYAQFFAFAGTYKGKNVKQDANGDSLNIAWGKTSGTGDTEVEASLVGINGGGANASMGIVRPTLDANGLPVMAHSYQTGLFEKTNATAKTVYNNVGFEFIYENATGYYTYNSELNHAQYNQSTNTIQLYLGSLSPTDAAVGNDNYRKAGFYPFTRIQDAHTHQLAPGYSLENKLKMLTNPVVSTARLYADYAVDLVATDSVDSTVDLHFGTSIAAPFYLPANKTYDGKADGPELIYEFTGDDDLWVFIDGQLVLDIGGGHTPISGSFNLTTGEVYIEKYVKIGTSGGGIYETASRGGELRYTDNFLTGLEEDQIHTIQLFYLERHAGVSNCRMRFNLPIVPEGSVLVNKDVLNNNGEDNFAEGVDLSNEQYSFIAYVNEADNETGDRAGTFVAAKNEPYTIVGGNGEILYTDSNTGVFKLKEGETAQFTNIPGWSEVKVVELDPNDGGVFSYSNVTMNGLGTERSEAGYYYAVTNEEQAEYMQVVPTNNAINFTFTNYLEVSNLVVKKELTDPDAKAGNAEYEVTISYGSNEDKMITQSVMLSDDETFTIENIPTGWKYSVEETAPVAPNGYKYEMATYSINSGNAVWVAPNMEKLTKNTEVIVNNILTPLFGDLIISKSGISELDNHAASGDNKEERQSSIFTITGTSTSGEIVNLTVVITGNGSITVKDVPVGTYIVEEIMDWTWRYTNSEAVKDSVEVNANAPTTVEFVNVRNKTGWLSGDNVCKNLWGKKPALNVG